MNRDEAQLALSQGHVLVHDSFNDNEHIRMKGLILLDERNNNLNRKLFWKYRQSEAFNKGWKIVKQK